MFIKLPFKFEKSVKLISIIFKKKVLCIVSPLHRVLYCAVSSHRVCLNKSQMPQKVKETKSRVFTRHFNNHNSIESYNVRPPAVLPQV